MEYLAYYCFIGLGVWIGLVAMRVKQDGYFSVRDLFSLSGLRGLLGALFVWPILIFYIEV